MQNYTTMPHIMTPIFRVSFPRVFQPDDNGKYTLVMLFDTEVLRGDKAQLALYQAMQDQVDALTKEIGKPLSSPVFKDASVKPYAGYDEGVIAVNAKNKYRPAVVDRDPRNAVTEEDFYGGCYAQAKVRAFAWNYKGTRHGITFSLGNIQKVRDGDRFGSGSADPVQDFQPLEGLDEGNDAIESFL